jgi:hypothetical protein
MGRLSIISSVQRHRMSNEKRPIVENEPRNRGIIYMSRNYARRCNADGSFDSICLHCFQTVASTPIDAALAENEMQHRCLALDLEIFEATRPSYAVQT